MKHDDDHYLVCSLAYEAGFVDGRLGKRSSGAVYRQQHEAVDLAPLVPQYQRCIDRLHGKEPILICYCNGVCRCGARSGY